ncbi:MAG: GAF domain-containing protein [Ktedonobacteraceae bacterium]|nr:GAF domain-containing protein [Ktedonobacteraceae bacterium]
MLHPVRRSLLVQLLSVYLLFVMIVLIGGAGVNTVVEQRLRNDAQASDQALAQEIALETGLHLRNAEVSLIALGKLLAQASTPEAVQRRLQAFQATHSGVDHVYWLDPIGVMRVYWPPGIAGPSGQTGQTEQGAAFSPPGVVQRARLSTGPVFEVGIAASTTINAGVILAVPVRTPDGELSGIVAASLSLVDLSVPLKTVVEAQQHQGHRLMISVIDNQGVLVATPEHQRILQTVLDELPGARHALQNRVVSRLGVGADGQEWLFSAVPVSQLNWAVIVQRPAAEALAAIEQFHLWLLTTALLFTIGGLLFWLLLLLRVIRPLHTLAIQHQELPASEQAIPHATRMLAARVDEVGDLARSLIRLERDGLAKLGELRTLLETSNAVVRSFEPLAVVRKIIREAQRLVDVQAAAVLLPDEQGTLRVLVSDGHSEHYNQMLALSPENAGSSAVLALRNGRPVQKLLIADQPRPSLSYEEGFRAVLAIPIISRHAGNVVLLVHRTMPQPFSQNEIDLLLTFANYATLAWEHAVLYERSDERLHRVAQENERLYRQAQEEKQRLEAIMSSMSDGLVLTDTAGIVLYANPGTGVLTGLNAEALERHPIGVLYQTLHLMAINPVDDQQALMRLETGDRAQAVVEIARHGRRLALHLRLFAVGDPSGQTIGRGLLLRDVTREREIDEFKTTLLAAVGHELRTPLAAIKGYASTLLQEDVTWSSDEQRYFLRTISSEADQLAQLVSNLLDLSRQQAGLLLLKRTPTRVRDLVAKVISQTGPIQARFVIHIPDDIPAVDVDSARIEVVLRNLVANALAYGEGEINIVAGRRDDTVAITIRDNGPGIAPDELPHIFERFYRARSGRSGRRRSEGTGLGLAICKAFVEAHGGTIQAESDARGTAITFTLPLACSSLTITSASGVQEQEQKSL